MVRKLVSVLTDTINLNQQVNPDNPSVGAQLVRINNELKLYKGLIEKSDLELEIALGVYPAPDHCRTCGRKF